MKKEFDAVKMMRDIRDALADKYSSEPEVEDKELVSIREKYNIKIKAKRKTALKV